MAAAFDPDFEPYQKRILAVFQAAYENALKIGNEAFLAAKTSGKNAAAAELREKVADILKFPPAPIGDEPAEEEAEEETEAKRAKRGSVRPAVIEALRRVPTGLKPAEIAENTGMNENSVRGTLNILVDEGVTVKRGDRWFLAEQK
jgi:hypothetical protein